MMSSDSLPRVQTVPSPGYIELPDEPRPGKITPSSGASGSPRTSKSEGAAGSSPELEEAIEEAIVRTSLPSPEPRPPTEQHHQRNGYKDYDRVDASIGLKPAPPAVKQPPGQRDVDEDSCLIKCVYFTQQCCECTII